MAVPDVLQASQLDPAQTRGIPFLKELASIRIRQGFKQLEDEHWCR
jgi:hypothetical protein